jgi:hypothetical protein
MKSTPRFSVFYIFSNLLTIMALLSCNRENLPPMAKLEAFPSSGDTSLIFEFDAGESIDDLSYAIALLYRWDFDGDGT